MRRSCVGPASVMNCVQERYPTYQVAWIYFVSFVICVSFVMLNLFIAVIIENFSASGEEVRGPGNQLIQQPDNPTHKSCKPSTQTNSPTTSHHAVLAHSMS